MRNSWNSAPRCSTQIRRVGRRSRSQRRPQIKITTLAADQSVGPRSRCGTRYTVQRCGPAAHTAAHTALRIKMRHGRERLRTQGNKPALRLAGMQCFPKAPAPCSLSAANKCCTTLQPPRSVQNPADDDCLQLALINPVPMEHM